MVNQVCAYALRATFAFIFVTLQAPALAAQLTEEQTRAEFAKLHSAEGTGERRHRRQGFHRDSGRRGSVA